MTPCAALRTRRRSARAEVGEPDRQPLTAPVTRRPVEDPGAWGATANALPRVGEVPGAEGVPVALDDLSAAAVAVRGVALGVVDVAHVGVVDARLARDVSSHPQGVGGRARTVPHLVVGVECAEVEGHVRAEVFDDPLAERLELAPGVVEAGDEQGGDLDPDVGLVDEVDQRL